MNSSFSRISLPNQKSWEETWELSCPSGHTLHTRLSCLWHCCLLMLINEPQGVWFQYCPEKSFLVQAFYPQNERIWGCSSKTCSLGEVWLQKNYLVTVFQQRPVGISTNLCFMKSTFLWGYILNIRNSAVFSHIEKYPERKFFTVFFK